MKELQDSWQFRTYITYPGQEKTLLPASYAASNLEIGAHNSKCLTDLIETINLIPFGKIQNGAVNLFRDGITPEWEDKRNFGYHEHQMNFYVCDAIKTDGGFVLPFIEDKVILEKDEFLNLFLWLCMLAITKNIPDANNLNGIYLKLQGWPDQPNGIMVSIKFWYASECRMRLTEFQSEIKSMLSSAAEVADSQQMREILNKFGLIQFTEKSMKKYTVKTPKINDRDSEKKERSVERVATMKRNIN